VRVTSSTKGAVGPLWDKPSAAGGSLGIDIATSPHLQSKATSHTVGGSFSSRSGAPPWGIEAEIPSHAESWTKDSGLSKEVTPTAVSRTAAVDGGPRLGSCEVESIDHVPPEVPECDDKCEVKSRLWSLECLERLIETLCCRPSKQAKVSVVCQKWRAALERLNPGSTTEADVAAILAAATKLRRNTLRTVTGTAKNRGNSTLAVSIWVHGLVRMSPAGLFFVAVEARLRNCTSEAQALTKLSGRFTQLATGCPASRSKIRYQDLVAAVAEVAEDDLARASSFRSDSNRSTGEHSSHSTGAGEWAEWALSLLPGAGTSSGLSCDAFACAAFGRHSSDVLLNCYNIASGAEKLAGRVLLGVDAIWHSGLVAHGYEYWYGGHVHRCKPGKTPFGVPSITMALGCTLWSQQELIDAIEEKLFSRFTVEGYDVLSLNCNDFCDALSMLLIEQHIPDTIGRQAEHAQKSMLVRLLHPLIRNSNSSRSSGDSTTLMRTGASSEVLPGGPPGTARSGETHQPGVALKMGQQRMTKPVMSGGDTADFDPDLEAQPKATQDEDTDDTSSSSSSASEGASDDVSDDDSASTCSSGCSSPENATARSPKSPRRG